MGWWSAARQQQASQWFSGPVLAPPGATGLAPLAEGASYLHVHLHSMHIGAVRRGFTRFYGALSSSISVPTVDRGRMEFVHVSTPPTLRDADASHLDRLVIDTTRLLGPTPYVGGDIVVEVGLFAIPSADLLAPYLALLEDLTALAGTSFVGAARPFVEPVTRGVRLLLGDDGATSLQVGLAATWSVPRPGWYAVARVASGAGAFMYDAGGRRLLLDNVPVTAPYFVYSVELTPTRSDWHQIPELADAYGEVRREASRQRLNLANEALAAFRVKARLSPDLVPGDAELVIGKVKALVDRAFQGRQTAGHGAVELPPLEAIDIYS